MAVSYWSGLGVSTGVTVTAANVNTAGSSTLGAGHTVAYATTGTAGSTATYQQPADPAGPGISITAVVGDLRRFDAIHSDARGSAVQLRLTPSGTPTANDGVLVSRIGSDTGFGGFCMWTTSNTLQFQSATGNILSTSPALVAGNTFQIDMIVDQNAGTPSTSNGRVLGRVKNLTNTSWNTTGEHFYDSGYTVNVNTTAQPTRWRIGLTGTGSAFPQTYFTGIRWADLPAMDTSTDPTVARTQFISAAGPPTLSTASSAVVYLINAVGTPSGGGTLSYSIAQLAGVTTTPTVITAGKWSVVQGSAPLTYQVTVTESGGQSSSATVVVPAASAGSGQYFRQRMAGGVLV